jgi:hypothetical protein
VASGLAITLHNDVFINFKKTGFIELLGHLTQGGDGRVVCPGEPGHGSFALLPPYLVSLPSGCSKSCLLIMNR